MKDREVARVGGRTVVAVSEMDKSLCVVADRFAGFANGDRARTVSGLISMLEDGTLDEGSGELALYLGQGIGGFERARIQAAFSQHRPLQKLRLVGEEGAWVTPGLVHKESQENVLLGNLRPLDADHFAADLLIHGSNEFLLDHQTGEHVQGMVIIEAIRQLCIGVFEMGYHARWPARQYLGTWKSMELKFQEFLFPLPAQLNCVVRGMDTSMPANLKFELVATMLQGGRQVASAEITFAMIDAERIARVERLQARRAVKTYLAELGAADENLP